MRNSWSVAPVAPIRVVGDASAPDADLRALLTELADAVGLSVARFEVLEFSDPVGGGTDSMLDGTLVDETGTSLVVFTVNTGVVSIPSDVTDSGVYEPMMLAELPGASAWRTANIESTNYVVLTEPGGTLVIAGVTTADPASGGTWSPDIDRAVRDRLISGLTRLDL